MENVEHECNKDNKFLRNRVRNELLPYLRDNFDTSIEAILLNRANCAADDISYLDETVELLSKPLSELSFGSKKWLIALKDVLDSSDQALRWRVVERAFKQEVGFNLGRKHSTRLLSMIVNGDLGIELPGGFSYVRKSGGLVRN